MRHRTARSGHARLRSLVDARTTHATAVRLHRSEIRALRLDVSALRAEVSHLVRVLAAT
ncbi:hypothetical protein H8E07_20465 [bacterium]|nr:hypothetical protein [bacterium]